MGKLSIRTVCSNLIRSAFFFMTMFVLNLRKIPFPRKKEQPLGSFLPGISVPFDFLSDNLRLIECSLFGNSTIFGFSGDFPTKISEVYVPVMEFSFDWGMGSTLGLSSLWPWDFDKKDFRRTIV